MFFLLFNLLCSGYVTRLRSHNRIVHAQFSLHHYYCVMSKKKGEKYPGNRCDSEGGEYQVERDRMKGKKSGCTARYKVQLFEPRDDLSRRDSFYITLYSYVDYVFTFICLHVFIYFL